MKSLVFLVVLIASCKWAVAEEEASKSVCLYMDDGETTPTDQHPNMIVEVDDFAKTFFVKQGDKACFDLSKQYYAMAFLFESSAQTIYGTQCMYAPNIEDAGKILVFTGENGGSPCPIE